MENLFDNLVLAVTLTATLASLVIYLSWVSGITEGVKVSEKDWDCVIEIRFKLLGHGGIDLSAE